MNRFPIDIVIPWVNPDDSEWKESFLYWKRKETGNNADCRYRDWGFIKYVFRSIEMNCPWCRNVFLLLASPSQIPSWLNIKSSKLRIVYHKEFIPKMFLPTFNTNVIEIFISCIKELSNNFILCNDDTFFCKKMPPEFFFDNDIPVSKYRIEPLKTPTYNFEYILQNNVNFVNMITNSNGNVYYHPHHLPVSYTKPVQLFILSKFFDIIKQRLHGKFRTDDDISDWAYYDFQCRMGQCKFTDDERGRSYGIGKEGVPINMNWPMTNINEGEYSTVTAIQYYIKLLNNKFNRKSRYEI